MKTRIAFLITLFLLCTNIFISCCDQPEFIRFEGLGTILYDKSNTRDSQLYLNRSVYPQNFGIKLHLSVSYYSSLNRLVSDLYATSPCNKGEKGSKESITALSITSDADIDELHKAGSDLKDLFIYKQLVFFPEDDLKDTAYKPIDKNYLKLIQNNMSFIIYLNKLSVKDSLHRFTFSLSLSDGRELRTVTDTVKFQNSSHIQYSIKENRNPVISQGALQ